MYGQTYDKKCDITCDKMYDVTTKSTIKCAMLRTTKCTVLCATKRTMLRQNTRRYIKIYDTIANSTVLRCKATKVWFCLQYSFIHTCWGGVGVAWEKGGVFSYKMKTSDTSLKTLHRPLNLLLFYTRALSNNLMRQKIKMAEGCWPKEVEIHIKREIRWGKAQLWQWEHVSGFVYNVSETKFEFLANFLFEHWVIKCKLFLVWQQKDADMGAQIEFGIKKVKIV